MDDYLNIQADFLDDLAADELNEDRARKLRAIAATLRCSPVRGLIAKVERMHAELEAAKAEAASLRAELLTAHAQAEEQSGKRAALQAAIDEMESRVWRLRNEVSCRIEHGADGRGHLEYVHAALSDILRPHATPKPALDAAKANQ